MKSLSDTRLVTRHAMDAIRDTASGAILECGVYAGWTSYAIWSATQHFNRPQYAADTFSGMPLGASDVELAGGFVPGYLASPADTLPRLREAGIIPLIGVLPGTLPPVQFCFVWMDLDLEAPTRATVQALKPLMVKHGRIGFHDYLPGKGCLAGIGRVVAELMTPDPEWELVEHVGRNIFFQRK